jgi:hypothetical protein
MNGNESEQGRLCVEVGRDRDGLCAATASGPALSSGVVRCDDLIQ